MESQLFTFKFTKDSSQTETIKQPPAELVMSSASFVEIRNIIYQYSGIYYTENKKYLLEDRLNKIIYEKNYSGYDEYIRILKTPSYRDEVNNLLEAITINETYFFRSEEQFNAFEKILVPEIINLKKTKKEDAYLRIWSAGTSTGEEAYTIAIIIRQKLQNIFPGVKFQVLASDINNNALNSAKKGIYKEYAVKGLPSEILNKYFQKTDSYYILSDEIKQMVKFTNVNLYDYNAIKTIKNVDVIFCVNVLIFFDIPSKQKVLSYLYEILNKGGYLLIGNSESLHNLTKDFKLLHFPKTMAYKKE
ncbi:MAG: protein-glutamate O-methyltransferase CheR [Bacteroidetes bacterium]|nr:MAG: protein-glutamate O-methyltransferase CheR [Bacteroidota bacterium]